MVLAYIGERGGYGYYGTHRQVFYSNTAAPRIEKMIKDIDAATLDELRHLSDDKEVKSAMNNKNVGQRFELLLDIAEHTDI
jgi:hypothetical protein